MRSGNGSGGARHGAKPRERCTLAYQCGAHTPSSGLGPGGQRQHTGEELEIETVTGLRQDRGRVVQ